jgi:hypothetical protein
MDDDDFGVMPDPPLTGAPVAEAEGVHRRAASAHPLQLGEISRRARRLPVLERACLDALRSAVRGFCRIDAEIQVGPRQCGLIASSSARCAAPRRSN